MVNTIRGKQIAVRVTDEEKTAFEDKARQEGKTPSEVLLQFVHSYLGYSANGDNEQQAKEIEARLEAKIEARFRELEARLGK